MELQDILAALPGLDKTDLKKLVTATERELVNFDMRRIEAARKAALEAIKGHGFSDLAALIGEGSVKAPRAKRAESTVVYRNPNNEEQTWGGRGRKPGWIEEALKEGLTLEDMKA